MPRLITNVSSGAMQSVEDDCGDGNFLWPKDELGDQFPQASFRILAEDGTVILAEDGTTHLLTES